MEVDAAKNGRELLIGKYVKSRRMKSKFVSGKILQAEELENVFKKIARIAAKTGLK